MSILIITCEHGSNEVPHEYFPCFIHAKKELNSHRGYDIHALSLAKKLAHQFQSPLIYNRVTRLLVDLNRSLHSSSLFSEFTRSLPIHEKNRILQKYYLPYRQEVKEMIENHLNHQKKVLHLSIHSFTPNLNGVERRADVGLLFDPQRRSEKKWCEGLKKGLCSEFHVRCNYPYLGISDGLATALRKCFSENYVGIEFEINQKLSVKKLFPALVDGLKRELQK